MLAVEHINAGDPLIKAISPKTTKGVLGKEVKYGVADSAANPNDAVQAQPRFITENKAVLITGSTSSAVAVALNKLAQREKVLYVAGISGSNDTTGKDCVRYGFRQCFYGQTAAAAIGPVIVKAYGKNKKAAYLTPDYTYGHTVQKSMEDLSRQERRLDHRDQPGCAARRARLQLISAQRRQFRRRHPDQRQLGPRRSAVDPAGEAVRHLRQDEASGSVPGAVPCQGSRRRRSCRASMPPPTSGGRWRTSIPLAKMFVDSFQKKYGYRPEWGANNAYMEFALWAEAVERAGSFYPPDVIKSYEAGQQDPIDRRRGLFPRRRPSARAAGGHRPRQEARRHEKQRGFLGHRSTSSRACH